MCPHANDKFSHLLSGCTSKHFNNLHTNYPNKAIHALVSTLLDLKTPATKVIDIFSQIALRYAFGN